MFMCATKFLAIKFWPPSFGHQEMEFWKNDNYFNSMSKSLLVEILW